GQRRHRRLGVLAGRTPEDERRQCCPVRRPVSAVAVRLRFPENPPILCRCPAHQSRIARRIAAARSGPLAFHCISYASCHPYISAQRGESRRRRSTTLFTSSIAISMSFSEVRRPMLKRVELHASSSLRPRAVIT